MAEIEKLKKLLRWLYRYRKKVLSQVEHKKSWEGWVYGLDAIIVKVKDLIKEK